MSWITEEIVARDKAGHEHGRVRVVLSTSATEQVAALVGPGPERDARDRALLKAEGEFGGHVRLMWESLLAMYLDGRSGGRVRHQNDMRPNGGSKPATFTA